MLGFHPREAMPKRGLCCRKMTGWLGVRHTPVLRLNG